MKVLFVTRGWPTKNDPMSGNYEAIQAKALARKGVEVTVLNLYAHSLFHFFRKKGNDFFIEDGVRVIILDVIVPIIPHLLTSEFLLYKGVRFYVKRHCKDIICKYGPFDLVHAHILNRAYVASPFHEICKLPFVITEHWSVLNSNNIPSYIRAMSHVYFSANAVISVSQMLADSLKREFDVESKVIFNMVQDKFFEGSGIKNRSEIVQFVTTGALLKRKGIDILIRAIPIAKHNTRCMFTIIGDGPEMHNLCKMIEDCGLQNQVKLVGQKTSQEISQILKVADCFILTSRRETFGIVYIEAMAQGLPVIATICGGPESFVNEKNGLLVPVENVEATAKAIDYMVEHLEQYNHEEIKQFCHENFSQDRIANQIIQIYEGVLNN